jgi:hypothetical protein
MDPHQPLTSSHNHEKRLSFLSLPPEIRNEIYSLSVPSNRTFVIGPWRPNTQRMQPPLTRVCKQMRSETLPMFVARNTFRIRASTEPIKRGGSIMISPFISLLLQDLEVQICPFTETYKVAVTRDLQRIWTWDMDINRAFHLPRNHVEIWTQWLDNLSSHQDEDGHLRSDDLNTMIHWLQKWN